MTREIKIAITNFVGEYLKEIIAKTPVMREFNQREPDEKLVIFPSRLMDQVEEIVRGYRKSPTKDGSKAIGKLPMFCLGFSKEYNSTDLGKGRSVVDKNFIVRDNKNRFIKVRLDKHDQRVQLVLISPDSETAFYFASQFKLFCGRYENRRCYSITEYHGTNYAFPLTLEDNNIFGVSNQLADVKNLTVMVFDLTFNCSTPYIYGEVVQGKHEPFIPILKTINLSYEESRKREVFYKKVIVGE